MSNSRTLPGEVDSQPGFKPNYDPLQSISSGRFCNIQLCKHASQKHQGAVEGSIVGPKDKICNSNNGPTLLSSDAHDMIFNSKLGANNAHLQSLQSQLLKIKASSNNFSLFRLFVKKLTYAILFLLFLFMGFGMHGAVLSGTSRWISGVFKSKTDILSNLVTHQIPTMHQNKENERICSLKSTDSNFCNLTEEMNKPIRFSKVMKKNSELKYSTVQNILNFCDNNSFLSESIVPFEKLFLATMKKLIYNTTETGSSYFFHEWLQSKVVSTTENITQRLNLEFQTLKDAMPKYNCTDETQRMAKCMVKDYSEFKVKDENPIETLNTYNKEYIASIIRDVFDKMMLRYNSEKKKLVDFASKSAGGKVLSVKQTENYLEKKVSYGFLQYMKVIKLQNSPEEAIQSGMEPGECWAYKGNQGILVLQLASIIHPTGFTIEHISISQSPSGNINSAPKDFSVWGLLSENDDQGKAFGMYSYDMKGYSAQYFPVQNEFNLPVKFVELRIFSNHGNSEYTCLYRFRVHGIIAKQTLENMVVF